MTREEMQSFRVQPKDVPILMELLGATQEAIAELDELDWEDIAWRANQIIEEHFKK